MSVVISSFFWMSFFGLAFFCVYSYANGVPHKDMAGFVLFNVFVLMASLFSLLVVHEQAKKLEKE